MKKAVDFTLALLLFLLPLKFGGLAVMPEAGGFYPEYFTDWLFISWPPHSLGFFGGAMLLTVLLTERNPLSRRPGYLILLWAFLLPLAALPGVIRGEAVILLGEISLLTGCGCMIFSAALILNERPHRAMMFLVAIVAGGVVTALYGWHQHLFSLAETRRFVAEQEAAGIPVSEAMRLKLTDPRIYSTLASSNALSSLLMIMALLGTFCGTYWSRFITPLRTAKIFFLLLNAAIWLPVLVLTRSRSAVFCPVAAGIIALLSHPKIKWKWRWAGIGAGILIIAAGIIFAIHHGRGVASMGERADYWRTCAILCKNYPLTGAGWGGFFRTHMQIKLSAVDESARDPHNVVAAFASQCGIPAGLLALTALLWPLAILWKERFTPGLPGTVFWCGVIFTLHSLIDCDWQVPALISLMGILYIAAMIVQDQKNTRTGIPHSILIIAGIILSAAAGWSSYYYLAGDRALARLQDKLHPPTRETVARLAPFTVEQLSDEVQQYRPNAAVTFVLLGDWHSGNGNLYAAERSYFRALEVDPIRPSAYMRLARLCLLRGDKDQAELYRQKAHALFPRSRHYTREALLKNLN